MPSSKTNDYDVEKIISKRTDEKGRIFYLIKWKGYSSSENTWEPEKNVTNCQDMIKTFEVEKENKIKSEGRTTRSSLSPIKKSNRPSRAGNRSSTSRKRASSNESIFLDDDYNDDHTGKKLSSKRIRKNTTDTEATPSIDSHESDILDITKLDHILDVRRNKKSNIVEYNIQVKKIKKPIWIKSDRLTEDYTQQVVDFLEEKYV